MRTIIRNYLQMSSHTMSNLWAHATSKTGLFLSTALAATIGYSFWHQRIQKVKPDIKPDGRAKDWKTSLLEFGSKVFQTSDPLKDSNIYLVGFHPMKHHPEHQLEAHHYCKQMNEDFAQCILFDSNSRNANLIGVEYIISENIYEQLPIEERIYWHPHNYEILSGMLCAPGLPTAAEQELLRKKMNSYGKTFHTWRARCWEGNKPFLDTLPKGDAILAWSFNQDGQVKPELQNNRDAVMRINSDQKRIERENMSKIANPQAGVNLLQNKFPSTNLATTPKAVRDRMDTKP